jgi:FkbM family methyltransferase
VNAVNLGMSDHIGPATLHDRADYNGSSHASLSSAIFSEVYRVKTKSETIDLTTVDEFCRLNHIDCIDLLKIDVEGYELNVLKGAKGMLNSRRVRFIQFEFTQLNSSIGVFFKDFYDLLVENYQIFRLLPHGIEPINAYNPTLHEIFGYQNFVCIPRK